MRETLVEGERVRLGEGKEEGLRLRVILDIPIYTLLRQWEISGNGSKYG
jgi:hypothetical protein